MRVELNTIWRHNAVLFSMLKDNPLDRFHSLYITGQIKRSKLVKLRNLCFNATVQPKSVTQMIFVNDFPHEDQH